MSSSFKDRLQRLHGSRKRAEERAERDKETHGVFSADDAVEHDVPPDERDPETSDETERPDQIEPDDTTDDSPDPGPVPQMTVRRADPDERDDDPGERAERPNTEVGERLARSYSLRDRSRGDQTSDVSRETDRSTIEENRSLPPNERAEMLRKRAGELIADGDWDAALPVLHEIVAILPRHAFALEKLAKFHRRNGDGKLANHYENRLRDVSPF